MKLKTLAIAMLSAVAAVGLSMSAAFAEVAEVRIDRLNVRSGPGITHSIRGTLPRGAQAKILETRGNWLYVVTGPIEGWIYRPYVAVLDQQIPGDPNSGETVTVLVCNGTERNTATVTRRGNALTVSILDRLVGSTWMTSPARLQTGAGVVAYINTLGEQTVYVRQGASALSRCSIQVGSGPIEPGVVSQMEEPGR